MYINNCEQEDCEYYDQKHISLYCRLCDHFDPVCSKCQKELEEIEIEDVLENHMCEECFYYERDLTYQRQEN